VALFSLIVTPSDAAVFTVTSADDSGPGTLRQAIQDANLSPEADSIEFNLPGERVHTVVPFTPLPEITNSVHIDGYTQPGSRANTLETGSDAVLCVRLDGIYITNGLASALVLRASSNHIGGAESLNTIAFNGKAGVCIVTGTANRIVSNSIFNNATLGIDLGDNGANTNDVVDLDDGPNELQNRPVLTKAYLDAGTLRASAILESNPNTTFTLQFFASRTWDPLWIAEGQDPLGNASVTTDAAGLASVDFSVTAPAWALEEAVLVTATATDPVGNTSEFSNAAPLLPATPAPRLSIRQPGVVPVVSWPAAAGEYQLQTAPSLAPGVAWEPITSGIMDQGSDKSYAVPNPEENPNRFFRLKK